MMPEIVSDSLYFSQPFFFKINELYPCEFKYFISRLSSGLHVQISNWKWPISRITITSTTQIEIDSLIAIYPPTDFFPSSHLFIRRHYLHFAQARSLQIFLNPLLHHSLYSAISKHCISSSKMYLKSICLPWSPLSLFLVQFLITSCLDQCSFPHCISLPIVSPFYNSFSP